MMIEKVKQVLGMPIEAVMASDVCLTLFFCYSKLYLNGGQPRTCSNSQRAYYTQLSKNGIFMATQYEEAQKRTCIPAWNGLKYLPQTASHHNSELLSDMQAIDLLKSGFLQEKDFTKLPEGYLTQAPESITQPKQIVHRKKRK